jgi:nucleotide-binding universal stress UspA family protein
MGVMTPYRRILVGTDFSTAAERAFPIARALARRDDATLLLAHAFDTATLAYQGKGPPEIPVETLAEGELESRLEQALLDTLHTHFPDIPRAETRLRLDGSPAHALVQIAERERADLIVLSTHGRTGLGHMLIGSVAERVVRHAPCSVLAIPTRGAAIVALPRRVLVGTDLSPFAEGALEAASTYARANGASTTLLYAQRPIPWVQPPSTGRGSHTAEGASSTPLSQLERSAMHHFPGLEVSVAVTEAESAVTALSGEAKKSGADLIVLASHGRTGLARMLVGSVAERTVRHAECPVLVVRGATPD